MTSPLSSRLSRLHERSALVLVTLSMLCFATLSSAQTPAPSDAERIATAYDTRSHDYDLVHQRIELSAISWDSTSFTGRVTTTLLVKRPGMDSVTLDAGARLDVSRVTTPQGTPLRTSRFGDTLIVHLARAAAMGDTVRFIIDYHAHIENGRGLTFIEPEGRTHRPQQIWSQGESQDNHYWFPTYDFPNDKMTWEVLATVPTRYTVVSNGRLVSDVRAGEGLHTVRWSQDTPSATYLVSMVIAPLAHVVDHWRNVPVDYYVYRDDSARARRAFGVTPDMIDVYSRLTGIPYPWAKYAQTTVADFFGGMENVSATTLVDWVPDSASFHDRPWFQYILIPHELAHQWFGDYVTTENWANTWLNEGFAEFMPGQYWSVKLGAHAEQDYYLGEYHQYLAIERQRPMPVAALGSNNIYPKGALVLEMLRQYLGPQRFWAALHYYLVHHALGTALTEDVREAVVQTTGENLTWFWKEWFYSAGLPKLVVTSAYDSTASRLTLTVRQTQGDSARADSTDSAGGRFTIPQVFRMPLTIRVGTAAADVVIHTQLSAREHTIPVEGLSSAPTMVVFDDGNHILKELTFEQPTAWLAVELQRDSNLWDRSWAIEQMKHRVDDSVAAAALANAAQHADYWLTRQEAAAALAGFPARLVASAVAAVTHDSSAAVRQAAATTLAAVDSGAAAARLHELLRDPSYEVRAAALAGLVRDEPANRSALISQGLSTPSYRDEIQDAALDAAAAANDTTLLPMLDTLARSNRGAMMAIAAMGGQGSSHAVALLAQAMDDPKPFVRQSAIIAIVRGLPAALALETLRNKVGTLSYADTRSFVETIIPRLEQRMAAARGQH